MKIKQLIILSFCLCGLAACEDIYKGGENHQQTEVAVLFKPSITSYDKDEVEKWKEGETVGVYMIRNKADFSLENSINQIFNKKMPCKDIKFSSKIKPFKIFEQSEMHWKN